MNRQNPTRTPRILITLGLAATTMVSGCGLVGSQNDPISVVVKTTHTGPSLFSLLPKEIQASRSLVIGSDASYPPLEFLGPDGKTILGFDADLAAALGNKMGITITLKVAGFDSIIPDVAAGKYPMSLSAFTDTKERQAKVDFVNYFTAGTAILVKKGNPQGITDILSLCGHSVFQEKGTAIVKVLRETKCVKGSYIAVTEVADDTAAKQAITDGKSDADLSDFPVASYAAKTIDGGNAFEVAGRQINPAPYGIVVSKTQTKLRDTIKAALGELISEGTYTTLARKYNITQGTITTPTINGA